MTDITQSMYQRSVDALESHRRGYRRYLDLLDGQRVALQRVDLTSLARLASLADSVQAEIQAAGRHLAPLHRLLGTAATEGPRTAHLRRLWAAAAGDAALVHESLDALLARLTTERDRTAGELNELANPLTAAPDSPIAAPANSPSYSDLPGTPRSTAIDLVG